MGSPLGKLPEEPSCGSGYRPFSAQDPWAAPHWLLLPSGCGNTTVLQPPGGNEGASQYLGLPWDKLLV